MLRPSSFLSTGQPFGGEVATAVVIWAEPASDFCNLSVPFEVEFCEKIKKLSCSKCNNKLGSTAYDLMIMNSF